MGVNFMALSPASQEKLAWLYLQHYLTTHLRNTEIRAEYHFEGEGKERRIVGIRLKSVPIQKFDAFFASKKQPFYDTYFPTAVRSKIRELRLFPSSQVNTLWAGSIASQLTFLLSLGLITFTVIGSVLKKVIETGDFPLTIHSPTNELIAFVAIGFLGVCLLSMLITSLLENAWRKELILRKEDFTPEEWREYVEKKGYLQEFNLRFLTSFLKQAGIPEAEQGFAIQEIKTRTLVEGAAAE